MPTTPSAASQRSLREMGRWLRKNRLAQGHTINDVADAVGRNYRWVSDVELGRRGRRMDPVLGMLWCDYLALDPTQLFAYLGLGDTDIDRYRAQHYLQTSAWAHRFTQGKRALEKALPEMEALLASLRAGTQQKAQAYQVRDAIRAALNALRIPQNGKGPRYDSGHDD